MREPRHLEQVSGLSQHVHSMSLNGDESFDDDDIGDSDDDF